MALRDILASEGLLKEGAGNGSLLAALEKAGAEITHMNAGTWAVFKNTATRNKVFDDLTAKGFSNLAKEGRTDIRLLDQGKTAAGFNVASPFARKLEDLVGPLMGSGSRISVSMGRGEFSSKMGMQIHIVNPNEDIFVSEEEGEEWDQKTEAFESIMQGAENALSAYFGLPVHPEGTEEMAVTFTVEMRVQS